MDVNEGPEMKQKRQMVDNVSSFAAKLLYFPPFLVEVMSSQLSIDSYGH